MSLIKLLEEINMPHEMCYLLLEKNKILNQKIPEPIREQLFHRIQVTKDGWQEVAHMKEILGEDPDNIGLLWLQLKLSNYTWKEYQEKKISRDIYIDTMKFFSRTVHDDRIRFKKWCFQTEEWGFRQLTLKIFRLGTLEYERLDNLELVESFISEPRYISIHIPGDAKLDKESRIASYKKIYPFMSRYFPEYHDAPIVCYSWLLSPTLKNFLPSNSKILNFQKDFSIKYIDMENNSYVKWIFQTVETDTENYLEETSLQIKVKKYTLQGGKIGIGAGTLRGSIF